MMVQCVHLLKLKIIRLKITKLLKRKNVMNDIEYLKLIYTDSMLECDGISASNAVSFG